MNFLREILGVYHPKWKAVDRNEHKLIIEKDVLLNWDPASRINSFVKQDLGDLIKPDPQLVRTTIFPVFGRPFDIQLDDVVTLREKWFGRKRSQQCQ